MNSEDELLSKQFCKFCIKVLQNEAKNLAGLSDREIGEKIGVVRQTVQYRRIISLKQLKKLLMKEYERNDEAF